MSNDISKMAALFAKSAKITKLKMKARRLYIKYTDKVGANSCGITLSEYISPDLVSIKKEFNAVMIELKALDPNCPDFKL